MIYSAIAQLVEQLTVNQRVAGSSPADGAIFKVVRPCISVTAVAVMHGTPQPTPQISSQRSSLYRSSLVRRLPYLRCRRLAFAGVARHP